MSEGLVLMERGEMVFLAAREGWRGDLRLFLSLTRIHGSFRGGLSLSLSLPILSHSLIFRLAIALRTMCTVYEPFMLKCII